jgi:hypothetical protein
MQETPNHFLWCRIFAPYAPHDLGAALFAENIQGYSVFLTYGAIGFEVFFDCVANDPRNRDFLVFGNSFQKADCVSW